MTAMLNVILGVTIFLSVLIVISIYRALIGPTVSDRVIAINLMTTLVIGVIGLLAYYFNQTSFIDVAILYAMIGFLMTVAVVKYLEKGSLK
jgi:multicomponent Na+:H+ antiporter subunit F